LSDVNAAAEAMGIPPDLVSRSAAARAEASGTTTDEVLTAWSGGGSVATKAPEETEAPAPEERDEPATPAPVESRVPTEQEPLEMPATPPGAPPAAPKVTAPVSSAPPVLVGAQDNPWAVVVGALGLFVAVVLLAFVGPSIPVDNPGARSSEVILSESGIAGQDVYASLGCASCHTQMIRPLIADVGLGPVTLSDTNQILGNRRHGPDLADIGSRATATEIESIVRGSGGHQAHNLSPEDMSSLVAYLLESAAENVSQE
jgi:mono/diheme cytochrome c family protein